MFNKIEERFIEEINSKVTIYSHDKTKARLCTIENDDPNKVFSIAFRTPPKDDTGLTHILEHSVLCGSKKYPLKDPFVELLKGSLNTFLNAFTFPDKTMYPVASMNDKDFQNLISVYLDAVFYPNIYEHEEIFKQEGWHYHIENKDDPITINGVVYNEMKGAFSDPEQVLGRAIMHSLYPDTCYSLESGGDPKAIPSLTYEDFKKFHSMYYHPSNSYIFLYGNCNMQEKMSFIENEYLNNYEYNDFDTTISIQKPFKKPIYEELYYPIDEEEDLDNNYYLSYNVSIGTTLDIKKSIALDVLTEVLFQSSGAPIKQALLDAEICEDVDTTYESGILTPFFSVSLKKSDKKYLEKFKEVLENSIKDVKLDPELILASLNFREFKVREAKFDGPKGLLYQMNMLDSWLYDDNMPFDKLEVLKYFKELKELINTSYYYDLLIDSILNNNHKSIVVLAPSKDINKEEEERLANKLNDYKNSLSDEELSLLVDATINLKKYQDEPSSKEAIDSLPKLGIEDLTVEPIKFNLDIKEEPFKVYYSDYFTNKIAYLDIAYDITDFSDEKLQYAKLLASILNKVSTTNRDYKLIDKDIKLHTGGLVSLLRVLKDKDGNSRVLFETKISMLDLEITSAFDLLKDVLFNTIFNDSKRIYELLCQRKNAIEASISGSGHSVALGRAKSYINEVDYIRDLVGGIGYLDFIENITKNFSSIKDEILNNLEDVHNSLFDKKRFMVSLTASKELYEPIITNVKEIYNSLFNREIKDIFERKLECLNEGIMTQYNVNFVARATKLKNDYTGALLVLRNAISLDYLWQNVRVKGGAYGCMIVVSPDGMLGLTSYRDPNIKRTNDVYDSLGEYINSLDINDSDMLKYKIGAIGALDDSMHVSTMGDQAFMEALTGYGYKYKKKIRSEIINATLDDLKRYGDDFLEALENNNICVIGASNNISDNKDMFNNLRKLFK